MPDAPLTSTSVPGDREGTTILRLSGPFTLGNLFTFQNEFRAMQPPVLILDMSDVPYMDSAGLGVLTNAHVSAEHGGRLLYLAGLSDRLMALLHMTRLESVLRLYPSVEDAQNALPRT
jgi:anti-anti-sigma factor